MGGVPIGGGAPTTVQSMTNTDTGDFEATLAQVKRLESAGCEIIRVSIPDEKSIKSFSELKKESAVPLVADIHFRADLAVAAIKAGADKVRINPGNIGGKEAVAKIVEAAGERRVPIRIGVNAGSISAGFRDLDLPLSRKLVDSALESIELVESLGFKEIIVSAKAYSVTETIETYRELAKRIDHPLHLGVTESGTLKSGSIRSAVGLGILLWEGIGDTVRVSLSADPVHEVHIAQQILQALEIRRFRPELIACPTCARCEVDLIPIARKVEEKMAGMTKPIKVAVMGCSVNGPGEARQADVGIAAGKGKGVIFKKGEPVETIPERLFIDRLLELIEDL